MRTKVLLPLIAHRLVLFGTLAQADLQLAPDELLDLTQHALWGGYPQQLQEIQQQPSPGLDSTDMPFTGQSPGQTMGLSPESPHDPGTTVAHPQIEEATVDCGNIQNWLLPDHISASCEEDMTVPLLPTTRANCPNSILILQKGLDRTITFDEETWVLTIRADPRPSEAELSFEVLLGSDSGMASSRSVVLRVIRECGSQPQRRILYGCACNTYPYVGTVCGMSVGYSAPSQPYVYSIGATKTFATGSQIVVPGNICTIPASMWLQSTIASVTKNGANIATPSFITLQASFANNPNLLISVNTNNCSDFGQYVVKTGTVEVNTNPSNVRDTTQRQTTINVQGGSVSGSLNASYTNAVGQTTNISLPTFSYASTCGETESRTFTPPANLPTCVTYTVTTVTATGCTKLNVGTYSFSLSYTTTYSGITSSIYSSTFTLTITCTPTILTASSLNTSAFTFEIGQVPTTYSPSYAETPDCGGSQTLSINSGTPTNIFTFSGGTMSISSTNYADVGLHNYTMKAIDSIATSVISISYSFTVAVYCRVTALAVSSSTIANVTHLLTTSAPFSQANTPIDVPTFTVTPSACATAQLQLIELSSNSTPAWISGTSVSSTNAALAGTYNVEARISVPSSTYVIVDASVLPIVISFTVTLKACALVSILPDSTPSFTEVYSIYSALSILKNVPAYTITPSNCGYIISTVALQRTDTTTTIPTFLTDLISTQQKIQLQSSSQSDMGTYNFKLVASITGNSMTNQSFTFQVVMCGLTQIAITQVADQVYDLASPASLSIPLSYTYSPVLPTQCTIPTIQVTMTETLNAVAQNLVALAADFTKVLVPATTDYTKIGSHTITITVTSPDPVLSPATSMVFAIKFQCTITPTVPNFTNFDFAISGDYYQAKSIPVGLTFAPAGCVSSYTWSQSANPVASFVTSTATTIEINTQAINDCKDYVITVTAVPQPSSFLVLAMPATNNFTLHVYQPCTLTSLDPQSSIATVNRALKDPVTQVIIPSFQILPARCQTNKILRLYETTSGSDVLVATFDESSGATTTTDNQIYFTTVSQLNFAQNLNSQASTHQFKITAQVFTTTQIQGMVTANPLIFEVNLICTIQSITLTNPTTQYCHTALQPIYVATPLTTPTAVVYPSDCPLAAVSFTLLDKNNGNSAFDPALITSVSPNTFQIDTQSAVLIGVYNYSWQASIATTATIAGQDVKTDIEIAVTGCFATYMLPSPSGPESFVYVVDPTAAITKTFPLPTYLFTNTPNPGCLNPYSIKAVRQGPVTTVPFTYDLNQISYQTTDVTIAEVQTYQIDATQSTCPTRTPLTNSSYTFNFTIACKVTALTPQFPITNKREFLFEKVQKTYALPAFIITPTGCQATYTSELKYLEAGVYKPLPTFIYIDSADQKVLVIDLADPTAASGIWSFELVVTSVVTQTQVGVVSVSEPFNVEFIICGTMNLKTPLPNPMSYVISSPAQNTTFPQYEMLPVGCIFELDYTFEVIEKLPDPLYGKGDPFNNPSKKLPAFLRWDPAYGIQIKGTDFAESWNKYTIKVKAFDTYGGVFNQQFLIVVTTTTDCLTDVDLSFSATFKRDLAYEIGKPLLSTIIEEVKDSKSVAAQVPSVCGPVAYKLIKTDAAMSTNTTLPEFATFDEFTRKLALQSTSKDRAGTWFLLLDVFYQWFVADPLVFHKKELLTLTLTVPPEKPLYVVNATVILQPVPNQTQEANKTEQPQEVPKPPPVQFIVTNVPKPTPKTNQKVELRFAQVYLKDLDESGKITLQMMEEVNLTNEGQKIDADMLSITFHKNSDEDLKMTGWDLVSYTKTQIQIQLNFNAPLLVSTGLVDDQVSIFLSKRLFLPVNEPYKLVPIENPPEKMEMTFTKDLPMQMPSQKEFQTFESVQKTVGKSATATIALSMTAQVALKGVMKKLWFYFNTVQLASTFTEFNLVKTPANVSMVKKSYDSIIHVKLIPDELMTKVKALFGIKTPIKNPEDTISEPSDAAIEPTHRQLSELSPKQIRNNQIALGAVLVLIIIAIAVIIIMRRRIWARLPQKVKGLLQSLVKMFIWNGVIRTLLEMFYPTTLVAMSTAAANMHNKSKLGVPIAQVGFFVGFFGVTAIHIESKKEEIDTAEYKSKYGAYFTNVETYIKPRAVHYSTIFLARRLTIALTIVWLKGSGVLQSLVAVYSSLAMLSWLILVMPLDTKAKNYLEMSNEFLITILGYYGFLFTDYVGNPVQRYTFGYVYIGLLAAGLFFNVINMLHSLAADFIHWWKITRHRKKAKQPVEQAPQPEQSPELYNGRKSIFAKLFEGEQLSEGDFPQVNEQSSSIIDYEEMLNRRYQRQPVNLVDQPKLITREMIDRYYRTKNAPQPFQTEIDQFDEVIKRENHQTLQTCQGVRRGSIESDDFDHEVPQLNFKSKSSKVGVITTNKMDEIFETIIRLQNKQITELEEPVQQNNAFESKFLQRQRQQEEAKIAIVEGRSALRKETSPQKPKTFLFIESESEREPDPMIAIDNNIKEINAYYDKMMAEFDQTQPKQHEEYNQPSNISIQGKRKPKSQERTHSRPKQIAPRARQMFNDEPTRPRQNKALRVSTFQISESDE